MKKSKRDVYEMIDFVSEEVKSESLTPCRFQYSFSLIQYQVLLLNRYHGDNRRYSLDVLIEYHHDKQYSITKRKKSLFD